MSDILPGYNYSKDVGRYRNAQSGKFVSRADIEKLLRAQVQDAESRYGDLATAFYEGRISPASFVEQLRTEQRRLALQNAALAIGGFALLSFALFGAVGASLRGTYIKIVGTAQDVVDKKVSLPQLLNRINGYVGEARRVYFDALRSNAPQAPEGQTTIERRILAQDSESCDDCLEYYSMGWQIAGTILPVPSADCRCGSHCRCTLVSRDIPSGDVNQWIGTKN